MEGEFFEAWQIYQSDVGSSIGRRTSRLASDAIVSMSLNQLFLGALALQQSPLPLRWSATIFGRQAVYVNRSAAGLPAPDEANYQLQGWAK